MVSGEWFMALILPLPPRSRWATGLQACLVRWAVRWQSMQRKRRFKSKVALSLVGRALTAMILIVAWLSFCWAKSEQRPSFAAWGGVQHGPKDGAKRAAQAGAAVFLSLPRALAQSVVHPLCAVALCAIFAFPCGMALMCLAGAGACPMPAFLPLACPNRGRSVSFQRRKTLP